MDRQWNMNKGKNRVWHNDKDYPVTVYVHNDDKADGGYGMDVHVTPVLTGTPDIGNPEIYAGFSLGGTDGSSDEFNQAPMPVVVSSGPIMPGFSLASIPNRLTEFGGTSQLHLEREVFPNPYWENMGLVIDVLTVNGPGDILIDCPVTGLQDLIMVTAPGRYELTLGNFMGASMFEIMLTAANGLDIILDSLGIPSLVAADYTGIDDTSPPDRLALSAWPNPFNPSVTFTFRLPEAGDAELTIFDLRGRRVATLVDGPVGDGERTATWHGRDEAGREVPAGAYVCRLKAAGQVREERVTLIK